MTVPDWRDHTDVARRQGGARTWTGWKATAAIIALVAGTTLLLNLLGSRTRRVPGPRTTPTVTTVTATPG